MPSTPPGTATRSLDVLIVDDEPLIRSLLSDFLEMRGHQPRAVDSPPAALTELQNRPCDLIITDIRMPHMDGLDLAVSVREQYPQTRILVMSGHQLDIPTSDSRHQAVDGFLGKPFTIAQLMRCVEQAVGGSSVEVA